MKQLSKTLVALIYIVIGIVCGAIVVFAGTWVISLFEPDPTARGAWSFTLFYTLPIGMIVGGVLGFVVYYHPYK